MEPTEPRTREDSGSDSAAKARGLLFAKCLTLTPGECLWFSPSDAALMPPLIRRSRGTLGLGIPTQVRGGETRGSETLILGPALRAVNVPVSCPIRRARRRR